jgi:uncharacterized membrane protein YdjX (TVP38/TMEM64 family)
VSTKKSTPRVFKVTVNRHAAIINGVSITLIVLSVMLIFRQLPVGSAIQALQDRIGDLGIWGPVVFGLLYVASVLLFIPGSALTLAAGALFGLIGGTVIISLASTAVAALAFLISRHLARNWIEKKVKQYPTFDAFDKAISKGGWKIVALMRVSPVNPDNIQNYLYGLTGIGFWTCVLTSWLAMLPGTFLYVYLGHVGRAGLEATASGGQSRSAAEWAMMMVGLLATITVTLYITHLARKALKNRTHVAKAVESSESKSNHRLESMGWPWGVTITALIALAAMGAAVFARFHTFLVAEPNQAERHMCCLSKVAAFEADRKPSPAAAMTCNPSLETSPATMLKRTKLAGIHQPGKSAAPAVAAIPRSDKKAVT